MITRLSQYASKKETNDYACIPNTLNLRDLHNDIVYYIYWPSHTRKPSSWSEYYRSNLMKTIVDSVISDTGSIVQYQCICARELGMRSIDNWIDLCLTQFYQIISLDESIFVLCTWIIKSKMSINWYHFMKFNVILLMIFKTKYLYSVQITDPL